MAKLTNYTLIIQLFCAFQSFALAATTPVSCQNLQVLHQANRSFNFGQEILDIVQYQCDKDKANQPTFSIQKLHLSVRTNLLDTKNIFQPSKTNVLF